MICCLGLFVGCCVCGLFALLDIYCLTVVGLLGLWYLAFCVLLWWAIVVCFCCFGDLFVVVVFRLALTLGIHGCFSGVVY